MDARRIKSRAKLRQALAELLQQAPLEDISIEQITDRAGVTRPTFYSNYQSRQDIINEHVEQWVERRQRTLNAFLQDDREPAQQRLKGLIEDAIRAIDPDDTLLQLALSGRAGQQAIDLIDHQNKDFFQRRISQLNTRVVDDLQLQLMATFYSKAIIGVLQSIFTGELEYRPSELAQQVASLVYNGIGCLLLPPGDPNSNEGSSE